MLIFLQLLKIILIFVLCDRKNKNIICKDPYWLLCNDLPIHNT